MHFIERYSRLTDWIKIEIDPNSFYSKIDADQYPELCKL